MTHEIDAILEKACSTEKGRLKATFVLSELEKLAPHFANEATREAAEEAIEKWAGGGDELRKGMAMAWLSRARLALAPGVRAAISAAGSKAGAAQGAVRSVEGKVGAAVGRAANTVAEKTGIKAGARTVGRVYNKVEGKAGDIGAAAGEKLARSPLNAKRMAEVKTAGGQAARERMSARLGYKGGETPHTARVDAAGTGGRDLSARRPGFVEDVDAAPAKRNFYQEQSSRSFARPSGLTPQERTSSVHEAALASAFRSGAENAANAHAGAAARLGRTAAKHAFKAGMQLAGAGAGIAAAGVASHQLSEAQHQQRVEAAKHSHDRTRRAGV